MVARHEPALPEATLSKSNWRVLLMAIPGLVVLSCGKSTVSSTPDGGGGTAGTRVSGGGAGGGAAGNGGTLSTGGSTGSGGGAGSGGSTASTGAASGCAPILTLVDTSVPDHVVGTGTAASCTDTAAQTTLALGGKITFNCGGPATITVTKTIALPINLDTVIDGGGLVTLDGGGSVRILSFTDPDYRKSRVTVTLQRLTLQNGKSTGTAIPTAPAPCSQGTDVDGSGSAISIRNGVLHVIDSTFAHNRAPTLGPDVGGALSALGSLEVKVQGSTFIDNSASNSGAIYMLNSDLAVVDSTFSGNQALGNGENSVDTSKCSVRDGEIGNGGNAAAIGIDGGDDGDDVFCGDTFAGNTANELGTVSRTPDAASHTTTFDRCTFDGNHAGSGGALYFHNSTLTITASTFSNNVATGSGAIQADGTTFNFTNVTFFGNSATKGLGGAVSLFGNGGTLVNCTFANNTAPFGSGYFAAAIAGGTALTIRNTLFDGNTSQDCGAPMACSDGQSTGDGNLQWPATHTVCTTADTKCTPTTTFADPALAELGDNGGPSETCLPSTSSPALGVGKNCPATDQRGMPRPSNNCAAGAVEP
jgi:predicted outer membrane repeat protein